MRKFMIKTFATLLAAGGLFTWLQRLMLPCWPGRPLWAWMTALRGWLPTARIPNPLTCLKRQMRACCACDLPWDEVNTAPGAFAWAYKSRRGL